jgi:predicted O-methyltransferase YrrM
VRRTGRSDAELLDEIVEAGRSWRTRTPEALRWVEAIEAERAALQKSDEVIEWKGGGPGRVREIARRASSPGSTAMILYSAIRVFRPNNCLELGTAVGISAAYQAAALQDNGFGRLLTLEGYEGLARQARALWQRLSLSNVEVRVGKFNHSVPTVLAEAQFDYAFIDGNHAEGPTRQYFDLLVQQRAPCALLVFDDLDYSDGMRRAWQHVQSSPAVCASSDLGRLGLVIVRATRDSTLPYARARHTTAQRSSPPSAT